MSYTPTTWSTGDTITASAMNKIENGIANASGALICNSSYSSQANTYVLDKTVQEIYDALLSGTPAYIKYQYGAINDYYGDLYLAPIVKIYNYQDTNIIRIVAIKPGGAGDKSSYTTIFAPYALIYSATGLDVYPIFYVSVGVNADNSNIQLEAVE